MKSKKQIYALITLFILVVGTSNAQTIALDFNKKDCNGIQRHLFEDLDSGKAVVLFFYMANCGTCPPYAQKVQIMVKNILNNNPGKVMAYAFPYDNVQTKTEVKSWVSSNALSQFIPMDSGVAQCDNYGVFGMPSCALVGGKDHKMVLFYGLTKPDTLKMRDSILSILKVKSAPSSSIDAVTTSNIHIYPNPSNEYANVKLEMKEAGHLTIDLINNIGQNISTIYASKNASGMIEKQLNTSFLPNGIYTIQFNINGVISNQSLSIQH